MSISQKAMPEPVDNDFTFFTIVCAPEKDGSIYFVYVTSLCNVFKALISYVSYLIPYLFGIIGSIMSLDRTSGFLATVNLISAPD